MLSPFSWTETIKMRLQNREKRPLNIVVGWSQKSHCNRGGGVAPLCQDRAGRCPKRCKKYSWPIIKLIILTMISQLINKTLTRRKSNGAGMGRARHFRARKCLTKDGSIILTRVLRVATNKRSKGGGPPLPRIINS